VDFRLSKAERSKPQLIQTVPQPGSMAWFEARREGLNHQYRQVKSPPELVVCRCAVCIAQTATTSLST